MRNIFSGLYWFLLISLLILACLLAWLAGTPTGASFLLNKGIELSGQKIQISELGGSLLSGLNATECIYTNDNLELHLVAVEIEPSLSKLLAGKLHFRKLKAGFVSLNLAAKKKAPARIKLPEFSSPVDISFDLLEIAALSIQSAEKHLTINNIHISGALHQATLFFQQLQADYQRFSLRADGEFSFSRPFPLSVKARLRDKNGSIVQTQVSGEIDHYQLTTDADIKDPTIPPFTAQLSGSGNLNHLNIEQLTAQGLDGSALIKGDIDWKQALRINTEFSAQDINPAALVAKIPGKISLNGTASFSAQTLETRFNATGKLREYPLNLETELSVRNRTADIRSARITIGGNVATLAGRSSAKAADDIVFQIDAPDLGAFYPGLGGKLAGNGRLHGQWQKPAIEANLKGEQIAFNHHRAESLDLNIQPSPQTSQYDLDLQARNILSGKHSLRSLSIKGKGDRRQQQFHLHLQQGAPFGAVLSADLSGQMDEATLIWRGQLRQLRLTAKDLPEYRQGIPVEILLSKTRQQMSLLCLQGPEERLCLDADIQVRKNSLINARLKHLPLKRFAPWLPVTKALPEHLSSELRILGESGRWQATARLELDEDNHIEADLRYQQEHKTLAGDITAQFDKLQWLNLFTEKIDQPSGRLNARLKLAGTIRQPEISGRIKMAKASARVLATGTQLSDVGLLIDLQSGHSASLSGELKSGQGFISIKGNAHWPHLPRWTTDINIGGHKFQAVNLPSTRINISPKLRIKGSEKGFDVSGILSVPDADINLGERAEAAIRTSPDEIIVGAAAKDPRQTPAPRPLRMLAVNADIKLRLGAEVRLRGLGLDTEITGGLKLREQTGKPVSGDGILKLVNGTYKAYGRQLEIEQGELYFNGPLDTPRVNLRVINPLDDIKVGLAITGTLQEPESRLFSTPPVPESDALSYLLTGKPLSGAGEGESNMLISAAAKLGLKRSAGLIDDIRSTTGFDTLRLHAAEDLGESELVVGKYLSSRLYLEYVTQLFADSEVFSLRYKFSDKLHLEAESSATSQALDLIYQFEK